MVIKSRRPLKQIYSKVKSRPKILYITSCWPHEQTFGGQLRTLHIGRTLQKLGDVTVSVVSSDTVKPEVLQKTAAEFALLPPVAVNEALNDSFVKRVRWALDPRCLNVHGCTADPADRDRLLQHLGQFDLVWVQNSRTPNILNQWRWPRSVLDIDDIPSTFQRTISRNGAGLKNRIKARIACEILRRRESLWGKRFDVLSVCSEPDREYLGGGKHIHVIPNGFERPTAEPVRNLVAPPRIGFIGLYSYPPNLEGMKWFLRHSWPVIKRQVPDLRLRLVGKDTDGLLKPKGVDIDALGFIENPASEMATWSAMVVPILHGAGTRVKIADAFSRKCPVVSTPLGAFGYDVQSGRELLLAESATDFANACVVLAKRPVAGVEMAERAFQVFLKNWTWDSIAARVVNAAEYALRTRPS